MMLLWLFACHGGGAGAHGGGSATDTGTGTFADLPTDTATPEPEVFVDCAGGGDYATIGAAIAAVPSGTRIALAPCTYTEDIDFGGKVLDIYGTEGSANTVIQGTGTVPVVTVGHGETLGTRLAGVTITGGRATPASALNGFASVLTLDDVVFTGNTGDYAVLFAEGVSFVFLDVRFTGNTMGPLGTGMYLDNGSLVAQRLTMDASTGASCVYEHDALLLLDSTLTCATAEGLHVDGGELHARHSRVEGAVTAVWAADLPDTPNERLWLFNTVLVGGDTAVYSQYMHVKADNDVFWGGRIGLDLELGHLESYVYDSAAVGDTCGIQTDGLTAYAMEWNAIDDSGLPCGYAGVTPIRGDPQFVAAPTDLHLLETSPLVDAGDPDEEDADGSRCDVGAYGGAQGAW